MARRGTEVELLNETGLNKVSGMKERTFNGRPSSTKKPAFLNEEWMKSERETN